MSSTASPSPLTRGTVAVTGATGYIGGRLVGRLLAAGYAVRCLVRSPRKVEGRTWAAHHSVQVVAVDLEDGSATEQALRGCDAAYWLVHSMLAAGADYAGADRRLATTFATAAERAGVGRLVYLGGLGEAGDDTSEGRASPATAATQSETSRAGSHPATADAASTAASPHEPASSAPAQPLSEHLASRREVERALAGTRVPLTVLRAAMILGAGSASFEILRYLVERLPVMVTPSWVRTECQPIAVGDALRLLVECLEHPETAGLTLDIGGPEVVTYAELIRLLAEIRGLPRRWIVPVPVLTPRLSSLWIHLVTPIPARIARPLAEGLRNRVVCRDDRAVRLLPGPRTPVREALAAALREHEGGELESRWSDAGVLPGDPDWAGGTTFVDERTVAIAAPAAAVFRAVCRLGGSHGWYAANWLWRLRGVLDRLVGGPGLRRGRRHAERVSFGEALDFWRVTALEADRRLELRAEMRLPGVATLTFTVEPAAAGAHLRQTARFRPRGLLGIVYWYALLPAHGLVFRGMLAGIRGAAEAEVRARAG